MTIKAQLHYGWIIQIENGLYFTPDDPATGQIRLKTFLRFVKNPARRSNKRK